MTDERADLEWALLGGERRWTRQQVAEKAGVALDSTTRLWRAMGFPDVGDDEVVFTDGDIEAVRLASGLVSSGIISEERALSATRSLGQSLSRLADWQIETVYDALGHQEPEDAARTAGELVPVIEKLVVHVWRRHLAARATRALALGDDEQTRHTQTVGFADLVGFTEMTRHVDEIELAVVVDRFEATASDVVSAHDGRVIKLIGDEVFFLSDDPRAAVEIGLTLAEQVEADDKLPQLRVGMALGAVLHRFGDVFGSPVNLASRLTAIARPGTVLVDRDLAEALDRDDTVLTKRLRRRSVRGFEHMEPYVLRRAEEQDQRHD